MDMIHIFIITLLDVISLFVLCNILLSKEEVSSANWVKWLVCVTLFYLFSRIEFTSWDQSITTDLQIFNMDILPVSSFGGTILLCIVLMISNSLFLKMSNQKSFLGTMFLLSSFIFIRVFAIILCSPIGREGYVYSVLFRIVTFIIILVIASFRPYHRLERWMIENNMITKFSVIITFVFTISFIMTVQFDIRIMFFHMARVIGSLTLVLLFNILIILVQNKQMQRKKSIKVANQYLPMIEELIVEVRARQHEFDNKLTAIFSILESANDIEEAKVKIFEYTKNVQLDNNSKELFMCENRIIAGVIYAKIQLAKEKNIEVVVVNKASFCNISTPEYELVEVLGILIDNAIEAGNERDIIYIEMKREEQYLEFDVSNPCESMSTTQFMNLFERGYSSKQSKQIARGYGLYNVKKIVEQYDGRIITKNIERNEQNYIMIGICLP
ncbi:two-component sensor histidine kinase, malate [Lachnospiraceae bacterium KM106-2]|nr:two-component sensor histidine kinase, malate [Lachnospiraceae bacterium KM106-2]